MLPRSSHYQQTFIHGSKLLWMSFVCMGRVGRTIFLLRQACSGHSNLSCRAEASWKQLAKKLGQGNEKHQDFQTLIQNPSITHTLLQPLLEIKYPRETLEESHDY